MIDLPTPRGEISEALFRELTARAGPVALRDPSESPDPLADEDLQLALYCLYELHYRGLPGVDDEWEWSPRLLELRGRLEEQYLGALDEIVERPRGATDWREMDLELRAVAAADDAPSLSQHLQREGTLDQLREFLIHRSAYQLKEADPHSWALPRLSGHPKAALVEIQADEYGGGRPDRIHARLFADAMDAFGLDSRYGAYVGRLPAVTLATVNLMSLFGLHRRWRGAIVGHLALFEMTSSVPNRRYGDAARRLGPDDPRATEFFDEHVEADAVHESVAAVDLAGGLARDEPEVAADILFGARALVAVEGRWAAALSEAWERQDTALLAVGDTVEASG
jgi:Iron-containing redox enzyme